jgi:sphingolipid delta-4 desaturase
MIAKEYYDNLPYHESWPMVTWKFVTDPNVHVYNRVKRKGNEKVSAESED